MSVSQFTGSAQHQVQFSKANSGYPATTTASPVTNTFSSVSTSGIYYTSQQLVASGLTVTFDMVSGGLQDVVGNTANIAKLISAEALPYSGAIQFENTQSGGCKVPQFGLSGGGILVDASACWFVGEGGSGANIPLSATNGNLVARAVSGPSLLSFGYYGL